MKKYQKRVLSVASALMIICFGFVYCIQLHAKIQAQTKNAEYFSDLGVVEAAGDAMKGYIDHHQGKLPDARNWEESISPYWHDKHHTVALKEHFGNRLAMNSSLSGVNIYHLNPVHFDGPIALYEVHSNTKDSSGTPPWKQCHQCGASTQGRLMIAFASGWSYSYAKGPGDTHLPVPKK